MTHIDAAETPTHLPMILFRISAKQCSTDCYAVLC